MPSMSSRSKVDVAHALAKAGLSVIPVIGGPAVELFQLLIQPPLEKRKSDWMNTVGEKLQQLEKDGLKLEDLQENEQFISAVMNATQAAMRTHITAKREALCNAVLNIAAGQSPDETVQYLLLSFIDGFTEMHLRILKAFHAREPPPGLTMGGLNSVLESAIPALKNRQNIYDQLWKDLYMRGLVNTESLHTAMSGHGLTSRRTTELGAALLELIQEPKAI
jgi:hypothetical protein